MKHARSLAIVREIITHKENGLYEIEIPSSFTDKELFKKIWTRPREVFRYINHNEYYKYVRVLLVFVGISRAFDSAVEQDIGDSFSLLTILFICIVIDGLLG